VTLASIWFLVFPIGFAYIYTHTGRGPVTPNLGVPLERISFPTSDGLQLAAFYVPSENRAAIVLFPGATRPKQARMLIRHGYGVLLLDPRGQGRSEGDTVRWAGDRDLNATIAGQSTSDLLKRFSTVGADVAGGVFGLASSAIGLIFQLFTVVPEPSVIALGALMLRKRQMSVGSALVLFAMIGVIHGYALGESIYGAEPTPLYAYLLGLAVIQSAVALTAVGIVRGLTQRSGELSPIRFIGAGIAGIGFAILMQQMIPAA
jgi:hydrogenase/urease accessory protein HupE